jgi:hypothetical protein
MLVVYRNEHALECLFMFQVRRISVQLRMSIRKSDVAFFDFRILYRCIVLLPQTGILSCVSHSVVTLLAQSLTVHPHKKRKRHLWVVCIALRTHEISVLCEVFDGKESRNGHD